jgi:A/G-specific adenine glycosylase
MTENLDPNTTKRDAAFIRTVRAYYRKHGRHELPWRRTDDPYRILVSEVMLQQTQVPRVILKYEEFLKRFPTVRALAKASLGDVLRVWQGLGYNRRAKLLHECAKTVVAAYRGVFPRTYDELRSLPGIGPYTAGAVMAFAYNKPVPLIETNVRSVYLHHYFHDRTDVPDSALMPIIERTLDHTHPGRWYAALMDYGTHLKRTVGNSSVRSRHYVRQSSFTGSDRALRGMILRELARGAKTKRTLERAASSYSGTRVAAQLAKLRTEGMIRTVRGRYELP